MLCMSVDSEVRMTVRLDTLERHRGERARLFLANSASGGEEVEEASALVELRQDLWTCVRTYTVYVRVSEPLLLLVLVLLSRTCGAVRRCWCWCWCCCPGPVELCGCGGGGSDGGGGVGVGVVVVVGFRVCTGHGNLEKSWNSEIEFQAWNSHGI